MNTKQLIIRLIVEDMRFHQYKASLRELEIEVYFGFDLIDVVAGLMGISIPNMTDAWMDLYVTGIYKAEKLPIVPAGKNLYELAGECYGVLERAGNAC